MNTGPTGTTTLDSRPRKLSTLKNREPCCLNSLRCHLNPNPATQPMPTVLLLSGSPSESSKSATLLRLAQQKFTAEGIDAPFFSVRDFPAEDLILGQYDSPAFEPLKKQIEVAVALVVSTPIYKAAYTGI
jgi:NADPH-dependent FMN reductase